MFSSKGSFIKNASAWIQRSRLQFTFLSRKFNDLFQTSTPTNDSLRVANEIFVDRYKAVKLKNISKRKIQHQRIRLGLYIVQQMTLPSLLHMFVGSKYEALPSISLVQCPAYLFLLFHRNFRSCYSIQTLHDLKLRFEFFSLIYF